MENDIPAYGLWFLVVINSAIFILFAFSSFKPKTKRDWRSFGAFSFSDTEDQQRRTGAAFPYLIEG